MKILNRKLMLIGMSLALVVLNLNTTHLEAQTAVNQKKASEAKASEAEIGSKKKGGGTVSPASVNGTGTSGQVAFWFDSDTLGSSIISQAGGISHPKIGIGTPNPTSKLTVNGTVESVSGGFKFPDETVQTTAFNVPLVLTGAPSNSPLVSVNNTSTGSLAAGVFAQSNSGNALHGISVSAFGVSGVSQSAPGVAGQTSSTNEFVSGIVGFNFGAGPGVRGYASGGGAGLSGYSGSGLAGKFEGNVAILPSGSGSAGDLSVAGNLSKASGSFKIDHPLEPENKYLYHSFVESPDMMNIYNGNAKLDANGEAIVELPEWFETLNRDFRYSLTALGAPGPNLHIATEVVDNHFKIAGGAPGMKISWQVTGIRQDPWANKHRIPVEEQKSNTERGYYLHPELFNQPEEKNVEWARNPQMMLKMKQEREQLKQRTLDNREQ